MTTPTFAIVVHFEIKPDHAEAFLARVKQQASDSLAKEPGCHQFDVLIDPQDPTKVSLYETYDDANAFESHIQTSHFADFNAVVGEWIANKQLLKLDLLGAS